ncbi:unnamed protein product [Rhizoctonia solani]|uniref:Uncharacterized protein n=1 Tax=Rhizoctonia solani TaxID=456999 RepID=A0A8H3CAY7_9AGAM|nr:unnamed protein product [Rhizoctonia solani]
MGGNLTALELVLTFLTMFGPATKESLAAVCVLFEAVVRYDYEKSKFDKDTAKVCRANNHLIAMAELYGVQCDLKQLATPGGRRAILRVILGPVIEGLSLDDLEQIRNNAVEAMVLLTFKPLDEVQDIVTKWANQAIKDRRYQMRVCAWTGLPMEPADGHSEAESSVDVEGSAEDEIIITALTQTCTLGLEIAFIFLTMLGPVTKESVEATGVLFSAILGYSKATGKFDKATVKMVPGVSAQLCLLARLYGLRCEPRILDTPPGPRAILREIIGPVIEEHSPAELEQVRKEADEVAAIIMCGPLERVVTIAAAWAAAAKEDARYQARVAAWTGKPVDGLQRNHAVKVDQRHITTMDNTKLGHNVAYDSKADECKADDDGASENSSDTPLYLEIATCNTVVQLMTVQALFSMDILPKQEASFTTMFPTPLEVCLGHSSVQPATFLDDFSHTVEETSSNIGAVYDSDEVDDTKELMDASDEEHYHRMVGFQFPTYVPSVPTLDTSNGSTPTTDLGSPIFEQWMTTWHSLEMSAWKAVLQSAAEKESQDEKRKAVFEPYADAWEDAQLSCWSAALKGNDRTEPLPRICVDTKDGEARMDPVGNDEGTDGGKDIISIHSASELSSPLGDGFQGPGTKISDDTDTSDHVSSHAQSPEASLQLSPLQSTIKAGHGLVSVTWEMVKLYTQLSSPISSSLGTPLDDQWFIGYILAQMEKTTNHWYFKPTEDQKQRFRHHTYLRLNNTKFSRWILFVSMGIIESSLAGDMSRVQRHSSLMEHIEGSLKAELTLELTPHEMRCRWSDWIHVSLIKTTFIPGFNTYQVLRSLAPVFLQATYSNPTLWPSGSDFTRVPLSSILASISNELTYFALLDCTYAMASGLPQLVEYDTTIYQQPKYSAPHQWLHSSPTELQLVLADINACRDKSPYARDWRDIEHQLLAWQSRHAEHTFTESWMTVAWYAVQESWRLSLQVYLYLAVCNASSDDPRIQTRVKQILQLVGSIKKREPSDTVASFFIQYLIVGICARSEAQRKKVRDKLISVNETKLWIMRASNFAHVLDHLWHGVAAGGLPIKWNDYMRSRETVLPM